MRKDHIMTNVPKRFMRPRKLKLNEKPRETRAINLREAQLNLLKNYEHITETRHAPPGRAC